MKQPKIEDEPGKSGRCLRMVYHRSVGSNCRTVGTSCSLLSLIFRRFFSIFRQVSNARGTATKANKDFQSPPAARPRARFSSSHLFPPSHSHSLSHAFQKILRFASHNHPSNRPPNQIFKKLHQAMVAHLFILHTHLAHNLFFFAFSCSSSCSCSKFPAAIERSQFETRRKSERPRCTQVRPGNTRRES